jgi:hypothetical protein
MDVRVVDELSLLVGVLGFLVSLSIKSESVH